jgi:cytochrome c peroxidase
MGWKSGGIIVLALSFLGGAIVLAADTDRNVKSWLKQYTRPADIPFPDENPYSQAKFDLGRALFFDPSFSRSKTHSCASCHQPRLAWGDGLAKAQGEGAAPLALRTPTLLNVAWTAPLGWDGKYRSLESVAFGPITAPGNMNMTEADLVARLSGRPDYVKAFADAFADGKISRHNIESALATFERSIVSGPAPFDRWVEGDDSAVDAAAKRGFALFNGKGHCAECHSGWAFTDGSFHDIGTAQGKDIGRGRLFPTSVKLRYAFKTPTLRDVARRAPYMHDGSVPTLAAVIELYDRGGIARPSRSETIAPLGLTGREKSDLLAFLQTLTSDPEPSVDPAGSDGDLASMKYGQSGAE